MNGLQITTRQLPNKITAISLKGTLDSYTYSDLEKTIGNAFDKDNYHLLINLSCIDYISCAGTTTFINAHNFAQENNGDIVFIRPSKNVHEVFRLLGLVSIFTVMDNQIAGLAALGMPRRRSGIPISV